jgi:uncharacterized protein (TIGR03437 family)
LAQQQDPSSPNYHRWLTPEQYAERFGVSQSDIDKMVAWLGNYNLTVKSVARGRDTIAFGGTAGQIGSAFGVEIHRYLVGGELHYANATDPTVPVAFQGVVRAIQGLHDFRWKPMLQRSLKPRDTLRDGFHQLAPDDIATIYDIAPLYNAGIDGTGQKMVVTGQTQIDLSDIESFRSTFSLPVNDPVPQLVPGTQDPGISQSDLPEADLDLELSGAVARKASIQFWYSFNVFDALTYAIDQNLAPVVTISYGDCELDEGLSAAQSLQQLASKANSQGQTIFAASGDSGAADCFGDGDGPAIDDAYSVDLPGSVPGVTSVGGTTFNEGTGSYWNTVNTANSASALSYIPETSWNDSDIEGSPAASGGGVSAFFSKPSWQTGTGVPPDGQRDVPDVSMAASPNHDGYLIVSGGSTQIYGGTSAGGPQFAGITVLLNQYLGTTGLGNINPALYKLATVSGVFHDITTGNNIVTPCNQPCTGTAIGYNAGPGYDLVTGLGTPDVHNLFTAWQSGVVTIEKTTTMALAASAPTVTFSDTTVLTATVTGAGGGTPTGTVAFSTGNYSLGSASLNGSGVATLTLNGTQLAVGANAISAQYNGDTNFEGSTASTSVTATASSATGPPSVASLGNAASYTQSFAPGGILSVFGIQLAPAGVAAGAPVVPLPTMMAGTTVTIDNIPAPLYYVSPTQLNIQIPYGVATSAAATLRVNNNGESVFFNLNLIAAAPAIFSTNAQGTGQGAILNTAYQLVDSSHPATAGSTYLQIYCMGLGTVSNQPVSGAASPVSPLAQTAITPQVTIGGVPVTPIFSGLAPYYVGLYQVNVLVPASVTAGSAVPVTLTLNGATSNTVTIAVGP